MQFPVPEVTVSAASGQPLAGSKKSSVKPGTGQGELFFGVERYRHRPAQMFAFRSPLSQLLLVTDSGARSLIPLSGALRAHRLQGVVCFAARCLVCLSGI